MKKKIFSNKKKWFAFWIIFHSAIIAAFLVSLFFTKGINFDADYTNMLPSTMENEASQIAEKSILSSTNSTVFILVGNKDFLKAKQTAETAYNLLKDEKTKFKTISLYQDSATLKEITDFTGKYRFNLLSEKTRNELLSEGGAQIFAENALSSIYGGFSLTSLENLENDPFLLDEANLSHYLEVVSDSGTSMAPKDGVLASKFEETWYVMIRAELTEEGARLASKKNAVPLIYEKILPLEKDGTKIVFNGVPFHSYKSSSSAANEISVISTVSLFAVFLILLFVFRSPLPIFASLLSIFLSILSAFCATHLIFGEIQMIALVFGTSLIGSCIDYSLHYFINWKAEKELDAPLKIQKHIFHGLILSLISTELCFILLTFAPFTLLKQMAIFSLTGIFSSFLTVNGLFTKFALPPKEKREIKILQKMNFKIPHKKIVSFAVIFTILVGSSAILIPNRSKLQIKNNISNLYKMEGRLKEDSILSYQILSYNPTSWLVVQGNTIEEVLQTEEIISKEIPDNFISTSKFIPSIKSQKESINAAEKLLPFAETQFEYLGFESECAEDFENAIQKAKTDFVTPESEIPATIASLLNTIWIGEVDGKYYSAILPSVISDETFYRNLADKYENVFFENKVRDVSAGLDKLTSQILIMFAIAFAIIAILMKFFYSWKETLKILMVPVLSILVIASVFVLADLKIEFFGVTGVILVFGLGLDYIIYKMENKENKTETFAIALSFLTTAISFGALALSSFLPVHVLGLSIFSGLVTAFVCAMI